MSKYKFTVPTLTDEQTTGAIEVLQLNLDLLNDAALVLKHAHWNVTGPAFIAVHEMLDPEIDEVRDGADQVAERIGALGGTPNGLSKEIAKTAELDLPTYSVLERASTTIHLTEVDKYFTALETIVRASIEKLDDLDLISSNILQDVLLGLEQFQWKVRSHLI